MWIVIVALAILFAVIFLGRKVSHWLHSDFYQEGPVVSDTHTTPPRESL